MTYFRLLLIALLFSSLLSPALSTPSHPQAPVCFINNNSMTTFHIMKPNFFPPDTLVGGQCGEPKSPVDLHHYSGGKAPIWIAVWQGSSSFIKRGEISQPLNRLLVFLQAKAVVPPPKNVSTTIFTNYPYILPIYKCSNFGTVATGTVAVYTSYY